MVTSISNTASISQLFSKLDTKKQGYLEQSDLVSAFSQINSSSSSSSASDVFAALDSNSDGKVTESEFSTTLSKLQTELESQFSQMRMNGHGGHQSQGMSGMPPPPPKDDAGFTKDELTSQLSDIGSTDSKRASFISNIVQNFSAADTNGDGKVSMSEAKAFNSDSSTSGSGTNTSSSSSTASTGTSSSSSTSTDAKLMLQIMQLMHAYGSFGDSQQNSLLQNSLSVSA